MKNTLCLLPFFFLFACSSPTAPTVEAEESIETTEETTIKPEAWTLGDLKGFYVGYFKAAKFHEGKDISEANKITISIDEFKGDEIIGHSIVAGNDRPFIGTFTKTETNVKVEAKEPGDDRYDGRFVFTIEPSIKKIKGDWIANNSKLSVYERTYNLERRDFNYDADNELPKDLEWAELYDGNDDYEGEFLTEDVSTVNASKDELKKEDIENMHKGDLEVIRNAIYARHGYSFKNRKMRYVFDRGIDWYIPANTDIRNKLTALEMKNIDLIKRYEQHAERYYDSYGR